MSSSGEICFVKEFEELSVMFGLFEKEFFGGKNQLDDGEGIVQL